MLRYLTSVPAGKVRFTIVDPVGLGENFAAFMHLGDYHELLVTNRIWTEAPHIEQQLTDLTEHMENVIQKYLRNEFETIEEYNTMAGEVAEPFRILVVANFPTNFNDAALRRLISIVNSGARCGVYALVLYDTKLGLPSGFQLKELEAPCVNMIWKENRLQWKEPNFGRYPLSLDVPPDQARFSELLAQGRQRGPRRQPRRGAVRVHRSQGRRVLERSTAARASTSRSGRAGATKLQHLKLGKGTSQHALTSGKTGSGKSTMLHALITNGALRYSPDELELYLIDFKKGVEFKVYAAMELPHARVIAVESEREFGLSVLQRLDVELKQRGEIYRELGCQDLAGYREARPEVPLPRILLIIDEFQEFFIEDDKIAQEVSLLLDRLVRQGRAFGMHVILGSQTLGGQYSLPKATLGQMAVRIALQCSEADAHLILSEDNTAARLLTRPGEAIYNDANGMIEGNNLFQVVWLSDERREELPGEDPADGSRSQYPEAAADRLRGQPAGRRDQEPALQSAARGDRMDRGPRSRLCLAGRRDRDQGPDQRRLPAAERQQRPDRRPERRGRPGDADHGGPEHRRPASARRPAGVAVLPPGRQPGRFGAGRPARQAQGRLAPSRSPTSPGASSATTFGAWPRKSSAARSPRPTIRGQFIS